MMNPLNCPTWALYEVGEPYHSLLEMEHSAFDHFLENKVAGEYDIEKYSEMFYNFRLDSHREKSPCFFLVWLRSKYPYEKNMKVEHYEFLPNIEDNWPTFHYTMKGNKILWIIQELGNGPIQRIFRKVDFAYINGKDIGEEYYREVNEGKVDPILENYFLGKTTYLENCIIRK
jgi:hypothetical protein